MDYSTKCIELVKKYEGLYLKAYQCASDVWTIGYGHTHGVYKGQEITSQTAYTLLIVDLDESNKYVNYYITEKGFKLNQCQQDSLVSFTFNCGAGNLRKMLSSCKTVSDIPIKMLNYNKNKYGVVLSGLVKRRNEEIKLFNAGGENIMFKTIKKGDINKSVGVYQVLRGLLPDNTFGQKTYVDVINFQRNNNLKIDGVVGPATWTTLLKQEGII